MHDFLVNTHVLPPRPRPIYVSIQELEDKPPHELIDSIRRDLVRLRGKLTGLYHADALWEDQLTPAQGGITCVLQSLAGAQEEVKKHHDKWGHNPQWLRSLEGK